MSRVDKLLHAYDNAVKEIQMISAIAKDSPELGAKYACKVESVLAEIPAQEEDPEHMKDFKA